MDQTDTMTPEQEAMALWSLETTRRLVRQYLKPGPAFSAIDLVTDTEPSTPPEPSEQPHDPEHDEPEGSMLMDLLGVKLSHHLFQSLLAEYPELTPEINDLSYTEALAVAYHHTHDR